jgi:hypothetical protein
MPTEQRYVTTGYVPRALERPPSELDNLFPEGIDNINLAKMGRYQAKMAGTR